MRFILALYDRILQRPGVLIGSLLSGLTKTGGILEGAKVDCNGY